jgi:multidrug efflux pump subunit AcrA (membrane-fusion protein)
VVIMSGGALNGVGNSVNAAQGLRRSDAATDAATQLVESAQQMGVLNAELLARDLAKIADADPKRAGDLMAELKSQLSPADQQKLTQELAEELDSRAAQQVQAQAGARSDDIAKQKADLALDLVQIGLSVAGIFDPTPISDGLDGIISLFRGDFLGAGISVVSMVPYIGDAAKLGKLGKFAESIAKAVDLAKLDPAFAKQIGPALDKIRDTLKSVPLDSLPKPAREALESMKTKLDEFAAAGTKTATSKVGKNEVTWKLDAEGYPVRAEGDLREVFPNATRSSSETKAQGKAGDRGQTDDVGGHIFGHRFVLDQGDKNLFPQNGQFNNSAYKKLENEWADWIKSGKKEVHVEIEFSGGTAARPDKMEVFYKVVDPATGKTVSKKTVDFDNEAGQVFDRTPKKDMQ